MKHGVPVVVSVTVIVLLPTVCHVTETTLPVAEPLIDPPTTVQRYELAPFAGVEYEIVSPLHAWLSGVPETREIAVAVGVC